MTELEKAIKMLKEKYELAQEKPELKNPIAWSLYKTWQEFERSMKRK